MINEQDIQQLQQLEESLWIAKTRFDGEYMEKILSPDFFEFGRSGKRYTREQTLSAESQEIKAKLPLKQFEVKEIAENVALITYISEVQYEEMEIGNRSSLWVKNEDGWKLAFHQGTPVN